MISYSPLLCLDFYKTAHAEQYPAALTKMVSYYTPRMTRLADTKKVTMFGLQAFIQEYLIEAFNTHFFDRSLDEVLAEYKRVLNNTIGTDGVGVERLTALHKLGYLPLEIRAVPEGTRTSTRSLPSASTQRAATTLESLPPEIPTTASQPGPLLSK